MINLLLFKAGRSWAAVLALVFALGCEPTLAQQKQKPQTLDDLFAAVATRTPEFGGMFLGQKERKLHVYLTRITSKNVNAVRRAIVAVFGAAVIPRDGIEARQGEYGFLQLNAWYTQMVGRIWSTPGVTFTDIDEAKNRLGIGVERSEGEARVLEQLAGLGIPRQAVVIQVTGPIEPLAHTVQMPNSMGAWPYKREGGYILRRLLCNQAGIGIAGATLGFNAQAQGALSAFVTVSHFTAASWNLDTNIGLPPADIYQSSGYYPPHLAGVETHDPHGFTGGACPVGKVCRYSDSVVISYKSNTSYALGRIARPTGITTTSNPIVAIDHGGNPPGEFAIVAKPQTPYLVGLTLSKVGSVTGWTQGTIQITNAMVAPGGAVGVICPKGQTDPTLPPANAIYLSQYWVGNAIVAQDDSGAPVFRIQKVLKSNNVELYGMLWGRSGSNMFVFSPIGGVPFQQAGIQTDLGPLSYCVPGSIPPC